MFRNLVRVFILFFMFACKNKVETENKNLNKVEVIDTSGKAVDFSTEPKPPPPTKEDLKMETKTAKKEGTIKIVKDCCTTEDSLEPKPPLVDK
jgi:hypothetical protein